MTFYSLPPTVRLPNEARLADALAAFDKRVETLFLFGVPIKVTIDPLCPPGTIECGEMRLINIGSPAP